MDNETWFSDDSSLLKRASISMLNFFPDSDDGSGTEYSLGILPQITDIKRHEHEKDKRRKSRELESDKNEQRKETEKYKRKSGENNEHQNRGSYPRGGEEMEMVKGDEDNNVTEDDYFNTEMYTKFKRGNDDKKTEKEDLTNMCKEPGNLVRITFDGYRVLGHNYYSQKEEKCKRGMKRCFRDIEVPQQVEWNSKLDSEVRASNQKKWGDTNNNDGARADKIKEGLASSKTVIKKRIFDSAILVSSGHTLIEKYTLSNSLIEVDVIDFGATVTAIRVFDNNHWTDVVLGFDNVSGYINSKNDCIYGTIGRVAGKIEDGKCMLPDMFGGEEFRLSKNDNGHHINGGFNPLHKRMWSAKVKDDRLIMSCRTYENDDGYPGNVTVFAIFSLTGDASLSVEYSAQTDRLTPLSISNGICFNLAGHDAGSESLYDHSIFINSDLCCDPSADITDQLGLVYETPYDLTDPKHFGCILNELGQQDLDVTYALCQPFKKEKQCAESKTLPKMTIGAIATHEKTGRTLIISTNQWGLRLHPCNNVGPIEGKGNKVNYEKNCGFSLQTCCLPNAINVENFPNIFLAPYESYRHYIRYYFTTKNDAGQYIFQNVPWIQEGRFLKCDISMEGDIQENNEDEENLYSKIYGALEKVAKGQCGDNIEDEDSLSLHSSFTSFGSRDETKEESKEESGNLEIYDSQKLEENIEEEEDPELYIKEPYPLPSYLIGKWPLPPVTKERLPVPAKKICPEEKTFDKSKTNLVKNKGQMEIRSERERKSQSQSSQKEQQTKDKIDCNEIKENVQDQNEGKEASHETVDENLKPIKNLVEKSSSKVFQWFEPPQELPWYCGAGNSEKKVLYPLLPEDERRMKMGTLFKLINYPEEYTDFSGTPEELCKAVNIKMVCLKSLQESVLSNTANKD